MLNSERRVMSLKHKSLSETIRTAEYATGSILGLHRRGGLAPDLSKHFMHTQPSQVAFSLVCFSCPLYHLLSIHPYLSLVPVQPTSDPVSVLTDPPGLPSCPEVLLDSHPNPGNTGSIL